MMCIMLSARPLVDFPSFNSIFPNWRFRLLDDKLKMTGAVESYILQFRSVSISYALQVIGAS